MKIAEARQTYNPQIKAYRKQQLVLSKQKQELEEKMNSVEDGKIIYANEAATLELTMKAVDEKQTECGDYMEDLAKIMEVARRLMNGDIVPATDEKKLMEYSMEMYQAAKNIGAMVKQREKEEYDSLWDEEEEKEYEDPMETADNTEAFAEGPEIVDVTDTMASVTIPE